MVRARRTQAAGHAVEQQRADHGVGLHDLALEGIEGARLGENPVGERELADVVHRGGELESMPFLVGPAHGGGESFGDERDALWCALVSALRRSSAALSRPPGRDIRNNEGKVRADP